MRKALALARKGQFTTAPNPNVGCVIVRDNRIVGKGYHRRAGEAHAEVHALHQAKEKARGATAYVTLEPCSHTGKTAPCADALIQAGIARVVVALTDPNPRVSGRGIKKLQKAGIIVDVGLLAADAEWINRDFLKRMRTEMPYIQLKLAASLDGKTALASGESQWITSTAARCDVQHLRAKSDAILSTSATVLADNPNLNVRWHELPETDKIIYPKSSLRQPVRIVLDSRHRLTLQEQLFKTSGPIWWVRKRPYKTDALPPQVTVLVDPTRTKGINLAWLFRTLGSKAINSVWVEAGARFSGALINDNYVDELIVYLAPKLLGKGAKGLCDLPSLTCLADAPEWTFLDYTPIGNDLRLRLKPKKQ